MDNNKQNFFNFIHILFKPPVLSQFFKPKDIPAIVPDCGWNHGDDDRRKP